MDKTYIVYPVCDACFWSSPLNWFPPTWLEHMNRRAHESYWNQISNLIQIRVTFPKTKTGRFWVPIVWRYSIRIAFMTVEQMQRLWVFWQVFVIFKNYWPGILTDLLTSYVPNSINTTPSKLFSGLLSSIGGSRCLPVDFVINTAVSSLDIVSLFEGIDTTCICHVLLQSIPTPSILCEKKCFLLLLALLILSSFCECPLIVLIFYK